MFEPVRIGIVGCGMISPRYFENAGKAEAIHVTACADLNMDSARKKAEEFGCRCLAVDELLADPEVEIVVNLTVPKAHVEVGLAALEAGKHVYSEKPIGVDMEEAGRLMRLAEQKGLLVGCAPDTFLGGGGQTSRKLVDDGWIGRPVAGFAFLCNHGPERYHPNPQFLFDVGAGPMMDVGVYYITALVNILGPVKRVAALTGKAFQRRVCLHPDNYGAPIQVHANTHHAGALEFAGGQIVTMAASNDIWKHELPMIEIHGTEGSMQVPDPNRFDGPVRLSRQGEDWSDVPLAFPLNNRVFGVADMASALRSGRPPRAGGSLACHVLEVMTAFDKSSQSGQHIEIKATVERPTPLPLGLREWEVD